MNARKLSLTAFVWLLAVVTTGAAAYGGPVTISFFESPDARFFRLSLTHGAIAAPLGHPLIQTFDDAHPMINSLFWEIEVNVTEIVGVVGGDNPSKDMLTISGHALHLTGPTGDPHGPSMNPFNFSFNLDPSGRVVGPGGFTAQTGQPAHDSHIDSYRASLRFTLSDRGVALPGPDDIDRYTFSLTGTHIPEPGSILFLGSGLVGIVAYRWYRRKPS